MKIKEIIDWWKKPDNMQKSKKFFKYLENKKRIGDSQVDRFKNIIKSDEHFSEIINKVSDWYNSDQYNKRWLDKGIQPPRKLEHLIFSYAEKYGESVLNTDIEKDLTMFTISAFRIHGYLLQLLQGQDIMIKIQKYES